MSKPTENPKLNETLMSYDQAKKWCADHKVKLADIDDKNKNELVQTLNKKDLRGAWIGSWEKDPEPYLVLHKNGNITEEPTAADMPALLYSYLATDTFNIASVQFPGAYLRMNAADVQIGVNTPGGAGTVNCQGIASTYEKFRLEWQDDGTVVVASVQFPGAYLRMDAADVHIGVNTSGGAGTVNCQGIVSPYEKLWLESVT